MATSSTTCSASASHFSAKAGLVALALKWHSLDLFGPIERHLKIAQKTVKYTPLAKLKMAFLSILSGAHTLVELNKQLRSEPMVYGAFGLDGCAEQSVVQQTLDHCTATTVSQTEAALIEIYRQFSRGYHHNYHQKLQLLDLDFTGLPCGPKAALATKGYFAHKRNRRGRQLGRVLATHYQEIVVDQLYAGNIQLNAALSELVEKAEGVLGLNQAKRARTVLRVDSGAARSTISTGSWSAAISTSVKTIRGNGPIRFLKA